MMTRKFLLSLFCLAIGAGSKTVAQQPLTLLKDSLYSKVLGEKRKLEVVLPEGYKPADPTRYDVLYLLDGEQNTTELAGEVTRFVRDESDMPPTIVIGIVNTDRNRDLLPTHDASTPTSGGADRFLDFMEQELIPYVNAHYASNGDNTLLGHSFGGVLVTYAMLTRPKLFASFIAADPSYWWDNEVMTRMAGEKLKDLTGLHKTFFISAREGQGLKEMHILQMDSVLDNYAPKDLRRGQQVYSGETHGSIKLKSFYDGLKFTYKGFNHDPLLVVPGAGILLKDRPAPLWCFNDTSNIHYTRDGSSPTYDSPLIAANGTLAPVEKVRVRRFGNRARYDDSVTNSFTIGGWQTGKHVTAGAKPGGLHYLCYDAGGKLLASGTADSTFDIKKLPEGKIRLVYDGELKVTQEGYYIFAMQSSGKLSFSLSGKLLIQAAPNEVRTYILPLKPGYYPIREEFVQTDDDREISLEYATPAKLATRATEAFPFALRFDK